MTETTINPSDPIELLYQQLDRAFELVAALHRVLGQHHGATVAGFSHRSALEATERTAAYWRDARFRTPLPAHEGAWLDTIELREVL